MSRTPPTLALAAVVTAALTVLATTPTGAAVTASPAKAGQHAKAPTKFNFTSAAYGSKTKRSDVPASSDATAFQSLGCTNLAGINRRNHLEATAIEGLGAAQNVRTRNWTRSKGGVVSSYASNKIERAQLSQDNAGSLLLTRLSSLSRAYHDASGFHTSTEMTIGDITYRSSDGTSQDVDPPTASQPMQIPGVLTMTVEQKQRHTETGANAVADALVVTFLASNTRVRLAHSAAKLTSGVKRGYFHGFSAASETRSTDATMSSGPQPLQKMPCLGTRGQVRTKSTALAGPDSATETSEAHTRQWSEATDQVARGFEEASIDTTTVGGGQLVLTGVVGRANVTRTKTGLTRDIEGTTIGSVLVNGQPSTLPNLDGFTIPGVVRVNTNIVTTIKDGIDVVAVRLTFLDGTDRVTDLGHASLSIRDSRLK